MRERLEQEALAWIKTLALQSSKFQVVQSASHAVCDPDHPSRKWDWVIDAIAKDSSVEIRLLVEVMGRVTPQTALDILARMQVRPEWGVPLLCCPVISARLQQLCEEHAVNYLDGAGNCRIAAPGLYIERRGLGKIPRKEPSVDLFAAKASRIVRAMLSDPARGWQVQRLARCEDLGVSIGLASKVKHALLEQGFAVERNRLLYVRNPGDLLKAWVERHRPKVDLFPLYVTGEPPQAEAAIAQWCQSNNMRYGLTQFSGAWRVAPAVRYQRSTVYVQGIEEEAWRNLNKFGYARRVDGGANVVLWQTYDPAVFLGERPLGDPPLATVSALQLYLDLKQLHGRGEEAAQAVHDAEIAPKFAEVMESSQGTGRTAQWQES
jgi:hypothetical protein